MIKVIKCEKQYSCYKYKKYTDADKHFLRIEKRWDTPWCEWEVTVPCESSFTNQIFESDKLEEVKKFLSQFNSVEELIGTWYLNHKKPFSA